MATPPHRLPKITPGKRVVMRLPESDVTKDPWTGAPISQRAGDAELPFDPEAPLAPPEGKTSAELLSEDRPSVTFEPSVDEAESALPKVQFSLRELVILTTIVAAGSAGVRILPPAPDAATMGVIAFLALVGAGSWGVRHRWAHLTVWCLLLIYLIAAAAALFRGEL